MQKNKNEVNSPKFEIRPASSAEAGLFYAQHPAEDERLGCIGHVRMDFGKSGNEFWHTWWPRDPEELNSPEFKLELQEVVDELCDVNRCDPTRRKSFSNGHKKVSKLTHRKMCQF